MSVHTSSPNRPNTEFKRTNVRPDNTQSDEDFYEDLRALVSVRCNILLPRPEKEWTPRLWAQYMQQVREEHADIVADRRPPPKSPGLLAAEKRALLLRGIEFLTGICPEAAKADPPRIRRLKPQTERQYDEDDAAIAEISAKLKMAEADKKINVYDQLQHQRRQDKGPLPDIPKKRVDTADLESCIDDVDSVDLESCLDDIDSVDLDSCLDDIDSVNLESCLDDVDDVNEPGLDDNFGPLDEPTQPPKKKRGPRHRKARERDFRRQRVPKGKGAKKRFNLRFRTFYINHPECQERVAYYSDLFPELALFFASFNLPPNVSASVCIIGLVIDSPHSGDGQLGCRMPLRTRASTASEQTPYHGSVALWNEQAGAWQPVNFGGLNRTVFSITPGSTNSNFVRFAGNFLAIYGSGQNATLDSPRPPSSMTRVLSPYSLAMAKVSGGPPSQSPDYNNPLQILCPQRADGPGNSYHFAAGSRDLLTVETYRLLDVATIRLGNSPTGNHGLRSFSVVALPDNKVLELLYKDPATSANVTCSDDCILSNRASLLFYGVGAGLHILELLSEGAWTYANNALSRGRCSSPVPGVNGTRSLTHHTGIWDFTTVNGDLNTQLPVLEFTDSVPNLAEDISDNTSVQFNVGIPVDGNCTG
ncbi:hypothetical protein OC861_006517 [Tilletia horrida]|nr:hypothetical protein OC861_006517 [Tilletia horrida]